VRKKKENTSMTDRKTIESELASLFSKQLNLDVPSPETDLVDTGLLDSLKFVELLADLEQRFGMRISPKDLEIDNFRSTAKIVEFVASRNGRKQGA
jgi:methoxymalonate biosynthesis acyl carrier protein